MTAEDIPVAEVEVRHSRSEWAASVLALLPGLAAVVLMAVFATWLSNTIGVGVMGFKKSPLSPITVVVVLGLVLGNLLTLPTWLKPGLRFSVKRLLRLGIILLGIRLSIFDVARLGVVGIPIVLVCVGSALLVTTRVNRWLKLPPRLGTLIAVGTSICGISAIVAAGPAIEAEEEEVAYAITTITIFGVIALIAYPYLSYMLFGHDAVRAGLFLGTAIHDTSQVTGAGLVFSQMFSMPRALDVATVTKLVRNVFMVAVIPIMAYSYSRSRAESGMKKAPLRSLLPWFVAGFIALSVVRSIGDAGVAGAGGQAFGLLSETSWLKLVDFVSWLAGDLLLLALCGVGLSARFGAMRTLGFRPLLVGLGAAVTVGAVSFVAIVLLGKFVA